MNESFVEGADFYYNDDGYIVLTEVFHLRRGYCCGNGCKHCPYDFINVPEPKRSVLRLEVKKDHSENEEDKY